MYQFQTHRDQAARVARIADIEPRELVERGDRLLDLLSSCEPAVIGGVISRIQARFEGAIDSVPGLQAMRSLTLGEPHDHGVLDEEAKNNFRAPLVLAKEPIENSKLAVQQIYRLLLERFSHELPSKQGAPPTPYARRDLEAIFRYYLGAAKLAGADLDTAAKAIEIDLCVSSQRQALIGILREAGFAASNVSVTNQIWPLSRPVGWPFRVIHQEGAFWLKIDVFVPPTQDRGYWLTGESAGHQMLLNTCTPVAMRIRAKLESVYGIEIQEGHELHIFNDGATWSWGIKLFAK